jgi:hypothetical protein
LHRAAVADQLSAVRESLDRIATLSDDQLNVISPAGSFRSCDRQRTL